MRGSDRRWNCASQAHGCDAACRLAAGLGQPVCSGLRRVADGTYLTMDNKLKRAPGVYLAGFMGSGKTTVARVLADRLGWDFIDLDAEIEAAENATIAQLFETRGEPEFRRIETEALRKVMRRI